MQGTYLDEVILRLSQLNGVDILIIIIIIIRDIEDPDEASGSAICVRHDLKARHYFQLVEIKHFSHQIFRISLNGRFIESTYHLPS